VPSGGADSTLSAPAFELLSSKLEPPADRPGTVARTALIDRTAALPGRLMIAVVAPPGYGKTTFLAQWAKHRGPRVAWVSCDDGDNDHATLLTYLAAALRRVEPAAWTAFRALPSSAMGIAVMPDFMAALRSIPAPVSVVIDHAEALTNAECRRVLAEFALRLPSAWQLAIASRHVLPLPVGRLRARGEIVEIGPHDLAMDPSEASTLINGADVDLVPSEVRELVERTEGWAAGLYLAALSIRAGTSHRVAGFTENRDESYMAAYLRTEFLDRASPGEVSFLTRTSVLDRMSGPLCDATLAIAGSARMLEELASRNLLAIPLDRHKEWYRYHQVFRRLLRAELERREPEMVRTLNLRAAEWLQRRGMPEVAIGYAQAAPDTELVARLVLAAAQPVWASGRVETVLRWMEWLAARDAVKRYPAIAVHGALIMALTGRPAETERWAAVAEDGDSSGTLADGSTVESVLAYLRAILGRDGIDAMRRDARDSWAGLGPSSPYRATMLYTQGICDLLEDDPDQADPILANAFDDALKAGAPPLAALVLAERCIVAFQRGRWPDVEALADQALAMLEEGHFEDYWTSALVYACGAQAALHRGDLNDARAYLAKAARLRPLLTYALPVVSVQALLQMARVYIGLADPGGATAVLRQAEAIRTRCPDLGKLWEQADGLQSHLRRLSGASGGASSLTAAELRLLPLLSTHLSLGEIAQQLHVTRHTVKAQTASMYRKLGVSSRGAVVARIGELGI
jgi:LuxR family transcriptional regulator, maltose regulon positive regulatory protein